MVRNTSQRSGDYGDIATYYRPGHADYTFDQKYGFRDYRGGGRSSGRETIGRVAAGAIAAKILKKLNISFTTYVSSIGDIVSDPADFDADYISKNELNMPDAKSCEAASAYLSDIMAQNDSIGSTVKCIVSGVPAGLGDPVFDKLDANLAKALMSIGAVKAVEIGDGVMVSENTGSYDNDGFHIENGIVAKTSIMQVESWVESVMALICYSPAISRLHHRSPAHRKRSTSPVKILMCRSAADTTRSSVPAL